MKWICRFIPRYKRRQRVLAELEIIHRYYHHRW